MNGGVSLCDVILPGTHLLGVLALQRPHAAVHADDLQHEAAPELLGVALDVSAVGVSATDAPRRFGCFGGGRLMDATMVWPRGLPEVLEEEK